MFISTFLSHLTSCVNKSIWHQPPVLICLHPAFLYLRLRMNPFYGKRGCGRDDVTRCDSRMELLLCHDDDFPDLNPSDPRTHYEFWEALMEHMHHLTGENNTN